ncbi:MAG: uracil-DNA glycosylase [Candidatus Cloacimonetes bacterium]|nr:uracil-DNA glycosylase [Candidatus Cloacimonadota bacterium]
MSVKSLKQYLEYLRFSGIQDIFVSAKDKEKEALLASRKQAISNCQLCKLWEGRIKLVYGQGNPDANMMLIGEGPGAEENKTGQAFVGKAGQLLTKMLKAINLEREEVFIANIVKCRPPGNRDPEPDERQACLPYLLEQIEIIQPQILLLLGKVAGNTILETQLSLTKMREQVFLFRNIPTYVSYHPSALLHNPQWKRPAWEDLQKVRDHYFSLSAKPK